MDIQPKSAHYWPLLLPSIAFIILIVSFCIWLLTALHPELPFLMVINPYTPFPTAPFLFIALLITVILLIRAGRRQSVTFRWSAPVLAFILFQSTGLLIIFFNPVYEQDTLWLGSTETTNHHYHLLLPGGYTFVSEFVLIECSSQDTLCRVIYKVLSYTSTNICRPLSTSRYFLSVDATSNILYTQADNFILYYDLVRDTAIRCPIPTQGSG